MIDRREAEGAEAAEAGGRGLTYGVIGAVREVHRRLGPGLLESIYERALQHELRLRGIEVRRQVKVPIEYKVWRSEPASDWILSSTESS